MLVLALDTTTAAGSVALARGDRLIELAAIDPAHPIATRVPGDLAALLARHAVDLRNIDLFAVATGPGSFTGLRIGIAAMQGAALAHGRPLAGVSSFEALASLVEAPRVAAWIDAWRGEVYATLFERGREVGDAIVAPPDVVIEAFGLNADATGAQTRPTFVGDGAIRYRTLAPGFVIEPTPLIAAAVARIAAARAGHGDAPPPHAIRPLYVRRPDAELARDRTRGPSA